MDRSKVKIVARKTWQFLESNTLTSPTIATLPKSDIPHSTPSSSSVKILTTPATPSLINESTLSPLDLSRSKHQHASSHHPSLKNPSDVDFINDTDFIVCDSDLHCIHFFTLNDKGDNDADGGDDFDNSNHSIKNAREQNGHAISSHCNGMSGYDHKMLLLEKVWPSCVVVTRDSKIRLTDRKNKSVKTFDLVTEALLSEWTFEEKATSSPQGVAVCHGGQTVVTDTMKNCVWVLDEKGHVLNSFGSEGDLLDQFKLPFYACVDHSDNVLVADNMNYCVKSFDLRANFLTRIGSGHLFGKRKFQSPYGVAYDADNHEILVADNVTNRIFTYDKQGTFLRYAVSGSECESPCGIAIKKNRLVVTLSNPDRCNVKLFTLEQ